MAVPVSPDQNYKQESFTTARGQSAKLKERVPLDLVAMDGLDSRECKTKMSHDTWESIQRPTNIKIILARLA